MERGREERAKINFGNPNTALGTSGEVTLAVSFLEGERGGGDWGEVRGYRVAQFFRKHADCQRVVESSRLIWQTRKKQLVMIGKISSSIPAVV